MPFRTESVDCLVLGAGPAGLRAAQVLAEGGREVVVLEKKTEIGPKVCAGGLTAKTVRELAALGLSEVGGRRNTSHVGFTPRRPPAALDGDEAVVCTITRRLLGRAQAAEALRAGAELRTGAPARSLDLARRSVEVDGRRLTYRQLIGADGADSAVRRALGLPSPRALFAAEYNLPGVDWSHLLVACDSGTFANGYFWIFPHHGYTSIGAVAPKRLVRPAELRGRLDRAVRRLGLALPDGVRFEGATLEVDCRGFHFADDVHLVGDAAGTPSALTAEGIYAALVSGEEVARRILDPGAPAPKTRRWLRVKRAHDALAWSLRTRRARALVLPALDIAVHHRRSQRLLIRWFAAG